MELAEFKEYCLEMKALQNLHKELKEKAAKVDKEFREMKAKALEVLETHGLQNFDTGAGKIIKTTKRSVSIENKTKFWEWLKAEGRFYDTCTVSAASATKIYNEEFLEAQANKDVEFLRTGIPGLGEPKNFSDISLKGFK